MTRLIIVFSIRMRPNWQPITLPNSFSDTSWNDQILY